MSAIPKPPPRKRGRKKPIRRIGGVAIRTDRVRQEFYRILLNGSDHVEVPHGTGLDVDMNQVVDPRFAADGTVSIVRDPSAPAYRQYQAIDAQAHHAYGRTGGRREDITNLRVISTWYHKRVTDYEDNTGRWWWERPEAAWDRGK